MSYSNAIKILNHYIVEGEKSNLIKKIASHPERYTGVFRPTKPRAKLVQNLLQSYEIRFGDALEYLLREVISEIGFSNLDRNLTTIGGKALSVDQYFSNGKQYFIVEQKIRDDHDSTKKHGQIKNFEAKIDVLYGTHQNNLVGIMYFIDSNLTKNKKFYIEEMSRLREIYQIDLFLFYGHEFFDYIEHPKLWGDLIDWITQWKASSPDFPNIDFDLSPTESFEEIKTLRPLYWGKIIKNETIWKDGIIRVLFSKGTTLKLLFGYFSQQQSPIYQSLAKSLLEKLNKYYY